MIIVLYFQMGFQTWLEIFAFNFSLWYLLVCSWALVNVQHSFSFVLFLTREKGNVIILYSWIQKKRVNTSTALDLMISRTFHFSSSFARKRTRSFGRRNNISRGIIYDDAREIWELALTTHEYVLLPH